MVNSYCGLSDDAMQVRNAGKIKEVKDGEKDQIGKVEKLQNAI